MLTVSAVFIEFAGAKLNADRLKNMVLGKFTINKFAVGKLASGNFA